jgi:hypothetical protein
VDIGNKALDRKDFNKETDFSQDLLGCHAFLSKGKSDHVRVRQKQTEKSLAK